MTDQPQPEPILPAGKRMQWFPFGAIEDWTVTVVADYGDGWVRVATKAGPVVVQKQDLSEP